MIRFLVSSYPDHRRLIKPAKCIRISRASDLKGASGKRTSGSFSQTGWKGVSGLNRKNWRNLDLSVCQCFIEQFNFFWGILQMCNLQWSNPNLTGFGTLSGFTAVIKHKWEPPFWSCSHSVTFELLHPWRQATVIVAGYIFIFLVLPHSNFVSVTHRFQDWPVTTSPSCCPFGFPCGEPSRTERFSEYNLNHFLRFELWSYGTFSAFRLPCSPVKLFEPASSLLPGSLLNLLMND